MKQTMIIKRIILKEVRIDEKVRCSSSI